MASFHRMCECDTWDEIVKITGKTRESVALELGELELVLGKKLIHRHPEGSVASSFSGRFFMPTDAGMKWYLLIGEMLKNLAPGDYSTESAFFHIMNDSLGLAGNKLLDVTGSVVTFSFFSFGHMQNMRIFTNSFLSFYCIESVLAQLLYKYKGLLFSTFGDEERHSEDFDVYFLPYHFPKEDFIAETFAEGKTFLYAHPSYIETAGAPKKLADLRDHLLIRSKDSTSARAIGVEKFGTIRDYLPTLHHKRFIEVASFNSLLNLVKMGSGIVALTDLTHRITQANLQKIAPLEEEQEFVYRNFTFGFHQKHKSNPVVQDLEKGLRTIFSNFNQ